MNDDLYIYDIDWKSLFMKYYEPVDDTARLYVKKLLLNQLVFQ